MTKHPHNRAERRRRNLATNRFRDHIHLNEEKKTKANSYKLKQQALYEQETEDELELH